MLISKEEFIKQQQEKSNMVGNTYKFAHHGTKKTFLATVTKQDKYGIFVNGVGLPDGLRMYYGSYHVLDKLN